MGLRLPANKLGGHRLVVRARFGARGPVWSVQTKLYNAPSKHLSALIPTKPVRSPGVSDPVRPDAACSTRMPAQRQAA